MTSNETSFAKKKNLNKVTCDENSIECNKCKKSFSSKNQLFSHLRSASSCLSPQEHAEILGKSKNEQNLEKIAVLFGYIPSDAYLRHGLKFSDEKTNENNQVSNYGIEGGDHAVQLLLDAIQYVSFKSTNGTSDDNDKEKGDKNDDKPNVVNKCMRSYGCVARGTDIVAQDANTGALTEVLVTRVPPLLLGNDGDCDINEDKNSFMDDHTKDETKVNNENNVNRIDAWVNSVNEYLRERISNLTPSSDMNDESDYYLGKVVVFSRINVPKSFNAEMDVSHRRIDYLIPADFFYDKKGPLENNMKLEDFFQSLGSFHPGREDTREKFQAYGKENDHHTFIPTSQKTLEFLYKLKKMMQRFCTQAVEMDASNEEEVLIKSLNEKKRKRQRKGKSISARKAAKEKTTNGDGRDNSNKTLNENNSMVTKQADNEHVNIMNQAKKNILKRRRFHNFTPKVMAHDYLSLRRLDRFYHRGTIRSSDLLSADVEAKENDKRPFLVLSLSGDLFLNGQVCAIIGLFIAITRGYIDEEILECVFDEEYPDLVPTPSIPRFGLFAGEARYMSWEGKMGRILSARKTFRFSKGFNSEKILHNVHIFEKELYSAIMKTWNQNEASLSTKLKAEMEWMAYLKSWSQKASAQLSDYRKWRAAKRLVKEGDEELTLGKALLPSLNSIDHTVPLLYEKVLNYLREADESGNWPTTTPKRQLVMISTSEGDTKENPALSSLSIAHVRAQINKVERSSAYAFKEGEGGASGSFSVGAMPGDQCDQPKANALFPELMKAAFELERALCPNREPSSTIAINRNAQFRPHVDSGAGAGQSTSLIVGLGTYVGGELMVEGDKYDIRYNPIEFNGWTQRHWTLPFRGERFSLVWFTPKGCEGVHGLDL